MKKGESKVIRAFKPTPSRRRGRGAARRPSPLGAIVVVFLIALAAAAWGCLALSAPPPGRNAYGAHGESSSDRTTPPPSLRLVDLIPNDLDALRSDRVMGALAVQLLLFGGFERTAAGGWERGASAPLSLLDRVEMITPAWKPGGAVDYACCDRDAPPPPPPSPPGRTSLFGDAPSAGTSVAELADALEGMGLTAEDFDGPARAALSTMLSWRLPGAGTTEPGSGSSSLLTLLVFSFDATPACRSVRDCPLPGPTNELLAATAARFYAQREREHGQRVQIVAQWEVAAAILRFHGGTVPPERVRAVGTPGEFENTAQIFRLMMCELAKQSAVTSESDAVVLAHPDHLRRVLSTASKLQQTAGRGGLRGCKLSTSIQLHSAMQPYDLDWPFRETDGGYVLSLFRNVKTEVHTEGGKRMASWYDSNLGFFPDGEPQRWVHSREVWILYDHWAMAKGIATGVIDDAHLTPTSLDT